MNIKKSILLIIASVFLIYFVYDSSSKNSKDEEISKETKMYQTISYPGDVEDDPSIISQAHLKLYGKEDRPAWTYRKNIPYRFYGLGRSHPYSEGYSKQHSKAYDSAIRDLRTKIDLTLIRGKIKEITYVSKKDYTLYLMLYLPKKYEKIYFEN